MNDCLIRCHLWSPIALISAPSVGLPDRTISVASKVRLPKKYFLFYIMALEFLHDFVGWAVISWFPFVSSVRIPINVLLVRLK